MSEKLSLLRVQVEAWAQRFVRAFDRSSYFVLAVDRHSTLPEALEGLRSVTYQSLDLLNYANDECYREDKRKELLDSLPTA